MVCEIRVLRQNLPITTADPPAFPHPQPSPSPCDRRSHIPLTMVSPEVFPSLWDHWWQVCAGAWLWAAGREAPWARHAAPAAALQCHSAVGRGHPAASCPPAPLLCKSSLTGRAHTPPRFQTLCSQGWHAH